MKTAMLDREIRASRHPGGRWRQSAAAWAACWLWLLPGCAHDPAICGLRPVFPPQRMAVRLRPSEAKLEFPRVASNPPVLVWEAYTPSAATPGHVTYDLRIWEMHHGRSATLVYEKQALPGPNHQVQRRLMPGTPHFWSVRARCESAGDIRFTDWSCSRRPCQPDTGANRPPETSAPNYFRFVTPGGPNGQATSELSSWDELLAASAPPHTAGFMADMLSWNDLLATSLPSVGSNPGNVVSGCPAGDECLAGHHNR